MLAGARIFFKHTVQSKRIIRSKLQMASLLSTNTIDCGSGERAEPKEGFVRITEGSATMDYDQKEAVFYNKVQVFNRDMSIQVIRLFAEQREAEKAEKHDKKVMKYNEICREQEAKSASKRGEKYDTSIDVSKVKLMERVSSNNNTFDTVVDAFRDENGREYREPFRAPTGIHILDALAATGLRSVRYLKEIPLVRKVTINDLLPEATAAARESCRNNGVPMVTTAADVTTSAAQTSTASIAIPAVAAAEIHTGDAIGFMYSNNSGSSDPFDVIDLDPYGTAAPFLDSAVRSVADGGLLCVTCTDMAVLSGNFPEKCFSLYGTVGLRAKYLHEASLRTLLHSIDSAANKHKRHIVPWLSLSVDFYIRVFVRVFDSPQDVKRSLLRRMMVHQSTHCESFYLQPMGATKISKNGNNENFMGAIAEAPIICPETGHPMRVGGPYWSAPIHDQNVVDEILRRVSCGDASGETECPLLPFAVPTSQRITAVLSTISEELKDVPLYYMLPDLAANVHSRAPPREMIKNALNNAGYRFSQFHHEAASIKTDAPPHVVWDIVRAYCKLHPPEGSKHKVQSQTAQAILSKEITTSTINFKHVSNNKWVKSNQGINDTPDNINSTSYSLTHRHSLRNKLFAKGKGKQTGGGSEWGEGDTVSSIGKVRYPMNPEKNWGPKRKAGRQNQTGVDEGEDQDQKQSERMTVVTSAVEGEKGRGKAFYIAQNKEKGEVVRIQREAERNRVAAAAEGGGDAEEMPAAKKGRSAE